MRRRSHDPAQTMQAMADLRAQYGAMQESRFRKSRPGVGITGTNADWHAWPESRFTQMREYAGAMVRDDSPIKLIIRRAVINIIRSGFVYEPDTGDEQLDRDLAARFDDWARDPAQCDLAGVHTWADYQQLACFNELVDGDVFIAGTEDGSLQAFEAYRCCTPGNKGRTSRNIVHGIELDEFRRRLRYYFKKETPGFNRKYNKFDDFHQVDAWERDEQLGRAFPAVWHVFDPFRFTQTRGVTALHPVFDKAGFYEDCDFALLVKEQAAACFIGAWETDKDAPQSEQPTTGELKRRQMADGSSLLEMGLSPGQVIDPPPGKRLVTHSPQVPSHETMAHLRFTLQIISLNIGVPLNVSLMDPTDSGSFSAWRGAFDQAKLGFIVNQDRHEARLHRPCANWKVRQWLAENSAFGRGLRKARERDGIDVLRHHWAKPRWPYIKPSEDAIAGLTRGENYLDDWYTITSETGRDGDDVMDRNLAFNKRLIVSSIKAAQAIKDETGVEVHWSDVAHRAVPKGGQLLDVVEDANAIGGSKKTAAGASPASANA